MYEDEMDAYLEGDYPDDYGWDDYDGQYDDDPSPYDGTYSED